jgi:glutamine amidotransferase
MSTIALVNYGAGNFSSVLNALESIGLDVVRAGDAAALRSATHVILPGVGAFAPTMRKLEQQNLVAPLQEEVLRKGKPFLGICVGMQVLATSGCEFEDYPGLGWIPGLVEKVELGNLGLRLPHIGWNNLEIMRDSPLLAGMGESPVFYFLHSYQLTPTDPEAVLARCQYGTDIVSIVEKGNIFGVQFHPEKSQHDGLRLLKNFSSM